MDFKNILQVFELNEEEKQFKAATFTRCLNTQWKYRQYKVRLTNDDYRDMLTAVMVEAEKNGVNPAASLDLFAKKVIALCEAKKERYIAQQSY